MSNLLDSRVHYKPFVYPECFEFHRKQHQIHWLPREVPLSEDIGDWNLRLEPHEKNLLTQIFRFFTQADVDVASGYTDKYLRKFGGHPEVRMMLLTFAAMEGIHIEAYSLLLDQMGMPEVEYQMFQEYKDMADKHDYLFQERLPVHPIADLALDVAVFSAFSEGMQLFSSFAMLMNFPRHNKMKGMGQIISWSIRDESLHVEGMMYLYRQLLRENPGVKTSELREKIYEIATEMVELEDRFVDLAFEAGPVEGMTKEDIKLYVRWIANSRLEQLGYDKRPWDVPSHPLPWLPPMTNAVEHANFFEQRATEYSKGAFRGNWSDIWGKANATGASQSAGTVGRVGG